MYLEIAFSRFQNAIFAEARPTMVGRASAPPRYARRHRRRARNIGRCHSDGFRSPWAPAPDSQLQANVHLVAQVISLLGTILGLNDHLCWQCSAVPRLTVDRREA